MPCLYRNCFQSEIARRLSFKLRNPGSILGRTSTQGLKITEAKELPLHALTSVNG